jgi:hypothetical protein
MLAEDVARDVAPRARARGIDVAIRIHSRDSLSGRDRRRWRYVLEQASASVLDELPAGSRLRVDLGCVATTSGHRWLQADLAVTRADGEAAGPARGPAGRPAGFDSTVVATAMRLLEGALDRTATRNGRVLRLVAPVET